MGNVVPLKLYKYQPCPKTFVFYVKFFLTRVNENIKQMLSSELELGCRGHREQQIFRLSILRHTCQQLSLASGQQ